MLNYLYMNFSVIGARSLSSTFLFLQESQLVKLRDLNSTFLPYRSSGCHTFQ